MISDEIKAKQDYLESLGYERSFGRHTYNWMPPYELPFTLEFGSDKESEAIEEAYAFQKWYETNVKT